MSIEETTVTEAIVRTYTERFLEYLEPDVAIVGGGPAGLVAARVLAEKGAKTALFEIRVVEISVAVFSNGDLSLNTCRLVSWWRSCTSIFDSRLWIRERCD